MIKYKQDLDNQMQARSYMKAYGNMSNAEKQINKAELNAYKNYDNNQYNLIPGLAHKKRIVDGASRSPEARTPTKDAMASKNGEQTAFKKNFERMAKYGL
jgi:hypothetical protein